MTKTKKFLVYAVTHPNAILMCHVRGMVMVVHSDIAYLSEHNAQSWVGGHFFMTSNEEKPQHNGAVLNIAQITKAVMSLAAKAELGALYINTREAAPV